MGLCCCARAFSSCSEWGMLSVVERELLILAACCGAQALGGWASVVGAQGLRGSVVVVHRLSYPKACEIFPDQGSNPCPLHWQGDSQPLDHQGRLSIFPVFSLPPLTQTLPPNSCHWGSLLSLYTVICPWGWWMQCRWKSSVGSNSPDLYNYINTFYPCSWFLSSILFTVNRTMSTSFALLLSVRL